jgi:hypothetical protein
MANIWTKTIATLNEYMNSLADVDLSVNLAFFDKIGNGSWIGNNGYTTSLTFQTIPFENAPILQHRYTKAAKWTPLSDADETIKPRGMTPLYDAICEFGALPKAQGLKKTDLVQFVVITDGDENTSTKYTLQDTKKLLAKFEKKNWPVMYLGANLEAFKGGSKIVADTTKLGHYNPTLKWAETATAMASSARRYMSSHNVAEASFTSAELKDIS